MRLTRVGLAAATWRQHPYPPPPKRPAGDMGAVRGRGVCIGSPNGCACRRFRRLPPCRAQGCPSRGAAAGPTRGRARWRGGRRRPHPPRGGGRGRVCFRRVPAAGRWPVTMLTRLYRRRPTGRRGRRRQRRRPTRPPRRRPRLPRPPRPPGWRRCGRGGAPPRAPAPTRPPPPRGRRGTRGRRPRHGRRL